MVRFLLVVLILALGALLVNSLADTPGEMTLVWQGWQIHTTALFAATALVLLVIVVALLVRLWVWLVDLPARLHRWRRQSRQEAGLQAFIDGLAAIAAGEASTARRLDSRSRKLLPDNQLQAVLGAEVARMEGDDTQARGFYEKLLEDERTAFLGLRGLAMQARGHDWDKVVELTRRAVALRPKSPWAHNMLFEGLLHGRQFMEAREQLKMLRRYRLQERERLDFLEASICAELAQQARLNMQLADAHKLAQQAQRLCEPFLPMVLFEAELYQQAGETEKARRLLAESWQNCPRAEVLQAWLRLVGRMSPKEIEKAAEKLVGKKRDSREGAYALGIAYLESRRWDLARQWLQKAVQYGGGREIYEALARLEDQQDPLGRGAATWLKKALESRPMPVRDDGHMAQYDAWRKQVMAGGNKEAVLVQRLRIQEGADVA